MNFNLMNKKRRNVEPLILYGKHTATFLKCKHIQYIKHITLRLYYGLFDSSDFGVDSLLLVIRLLVMSLSKVKVFNFELLILHQNYLILKYRYGFSFQLKRTTLDYR